MPQATLDQHPAPDKPKLTFIQKCKTMRGQQIICTLVFLFVPLLLLFTFTYLPFFKMVHPGNRYALAEEHQYGKTEM